MERRILQEKDPSGNKPKIYVYEGSLIEVLPYFLYEVSIYKYWKFGACMLGNRFFKSDKFLRIRQTNELKYYNGYTIEKETILVGAPYSFIKENDLPVYEQNFKRKKLKKK